jgi:hypothetical protein
VLQQQGDRPAQLVVSASYESLRLPRTERATGRLVTYGPGAIDWARGTEQAAAFVTAQDPAVGELARAVAADVARRGAGPFVVRNVATGAALFEALGALGVAYVPDPNNPYARMSSTPHAVDTVRYPRETLRSLAGDCDDTTVLCAALLGSVGIATQFVEVPEHLFLLADTGVPAQHRAALGVEDELLVVRDERVWLPLETTAIARGFPAGWREGAERYRQDAARGRLETVNVLAAQAIYPPADPPALESSVALRVPPDLEARLERAGAAVAEWRQAYLQERYGDIERGLASSPAALEQVAHVHYLAGDLAGARSRLQELLAREPQSAAARNDLALVDAAEGDVGAAIAGCRAALEADSTDAGIWLNLGILRHAGGDEAGSARALEIGVRQSGGTVAACRLLGLAPDSSAARGAEPTLTAAEARALLEDAIRRVPLADSSAAPLAGKPSKTAAAADSTAQRTLHARVGASRGAAGASLRQILYWKEVEG